MNRPSFCILVLLVLAGCQSTDQAGTTPARHGDSLQPTLWMQTSPEYRANARLVYAVARRQLAALKADPGLSGDLEQAAQYGCQAGRTCGALAVARLIPAVVLDIDETVLDNSAYQARRALEGASFDPVSWDLWLAERAARAVPGAAAFIAAARAEGIAIVYITNRQCAARPGAADPCPQRGDTIANLARVGIPSLGDQDLLLLRAERPAWDESEKQARRAFVATRYRLMMLIGDDIGDLASHVKALPIPDKAAFVDEHEHLLGVHWLQLVNPVYGSWTRSFGTTPPRDHLRTDATH
ncbi:MAG: acid phosphatase [Proteobacteria bacterium]|jgi:5'-nucleotidase (lipoprotein e(P4) family)|nr:acid phosphatase [Pseudomonadota bacterium]MDA1301444.1 acid phosphatase [Pseudomonadota bacterium]